MIKKKKTCGCQHQGIRITVNWEAHLPMLQRCLVTRSSSQKRLSVWGRLLAPSLYHVEKFMWLRKTYPLLEVTRVHLPTSPVLRLWVFNLTSFARKMTSVSPGKKAHAPETRVATSNSCRGGSWKITLMNAQQSRLVC